MLGRIGRDVLQPRTAAVGDRLLHRGRLPAPGGHRRPDLQRERTARADVVAQRAEPALDVVGHPRPVEHRTLRHVRERARQPRDRSVEHQRGTHDRGAVDPAEPLGPPVGLHRGPARGLQERGGRSGGEERLVLDLVEESKAVRHARAPRGQAVSVGGSVRQVRICACGDRRGPGRVSAPRDDGRLRTFRTRRPRLRWNIRANDVRDGVTAR